MQIGISTACLYPLNTEEALLCLAQQGFKGIEIFINCDMELHEPVSSEISRIIREYSLTIPAVHPVAALDSFFLFSNYERRKTQFLDACKLYFERMNEWNAPLMVFHGMKKDSDRSDELYFERYAELCALAEKYNITIAQENVAYCRSSDLDFLVKMKNELNAMFTLDLKQARRSGLSAFEILDKLGENVVHIHASDGGGEPGDCLLIGQGSFDFAGFFAKLKELNYNKSVILELYRENFDSDDDLKESVEKLVDICENL
ncbi:MAG: sugar phosphate isomerase/epimerase [Oscillospiraceae bacterium]|nr:sugar phosphate isomerase/epimerase [Oscillospiraceae bacterium]